MLLLWTLFSACKEEVGPPAPPSACEEVDCAPGACEEREGKPLCSCPAGYVPTEQGCAAQPPQGEDDHGDTPSEATALVPGRAEAVLGGPEDLDVFCFQVVAGRVYRFACMAPFFGYDSICAVRLLSASGETISSAGLVWYTGYEAPANGTLCAEVRPFSASSRFPASYNSLLEDVGPDDHGDTPETATVLQPGTGLAVAQFELASDVDAFAFDAVAGHAYHFTCADRYGCRVKLRDATGTVVSEQLSGLGYEVAATGRYTLEVTFAPLLLSANLGPYHYSLVDLGLDDHGDDAATATELSFGTPTAGRYETPQDVDVFRFTAPAGQTVRFSCQMDGTSQCSPRLKDSAGTLLEERQESVAYAAGSSPVVLFVEVRNAASRGNVPYTYHLENLGPDDHGDSAETASPLAGNPPEGTGRLLTGSDSDFFRWEATPGGFYRVTCTSTEVDCGLRAHGSAGPLAEALRTPLEVKATGPLFLEVFGIRPRDRGGYGLRLEELGLDDHGDTRDTATRLTLGSPVSGHLTVASDVDVFAVTLEAERVYEITALSGSVEFTVRGPFDTLEGSGVLLDATPRTFVPQHSGDHLLELRQARGAVLMNYQLRLR